MLTDTHCHLNFQAFSADLDAVIARAREAGVTTMIIPGAKIDSSERAVEIARMYPGCYAAVGIHPHHAGDMVLVETPSQTWLSLRALCHDPAVVAIGEIGLDRYHYKNTPPPTQETIDRQKDLLTTQLDIARTFGLPVIIHCREAQEDLMELIVRYQEKHQTRLSGVFHCFDGDTEYLKSVLALGFYVGFDGNSTYPANEHLRRLISTTPLDRLLLETDAPYLTPIPHRHDRNEPSYLPLLAQLVAQIYHKTVEDIASTTSENAQRLFKYPPRHGTLRQGV